MQVAIAALFLGSGRDSLSREEILKEACMKRRWFSPELLDNFLENALSSGYLLKEGERFMPSFDVREVDVPIGYYPDGSLLERDEEKDDDGTVEIPSMDYPFIDEVKTAMYLAEKGEDISDILKKAEDVLLK